MNKLTEIKEAMKEVTPGPWEWQRDIRELKGETEKVMICSYELVPRVADAELIANAPEYITYLLSLIEEKDKALAKLADRTNYMMINASEGDELGLTWILDGEAHEIAQAALTSSNNKGEI